MAKTQNLSLNPTKISGTCGRLMCCLKYEQDAYEDLIRNSPKLESFVDTPEGRGTVIELDLLRQRVKVRMEERPEITGVFSNEEIAVLRSGKAKKNDPPIPADLAPISGKGKRVKTEEQQESAFLDPIRFRYSTEAIVEEPEQEPEVPEEIPEETEHQKNKRRRNRKPKTQEQPQQTETAPQEAKPEKKKQPKKAEPTESAETEQNHPDEAAPAKKRYNHHYRRRKPKSSGGEKNNG